VGRSLTIYVLCLGVYTSLETRKEIGQTCVGLSVGKSLTIYIAYTPRLRPGWAWGRLVLVGRSVAIYILFLGLYTLVKENRFKRS